MTNLYEKSIAKLELDRVLERLSQYAGSTAGKAACRCLTPVSDIEDVRELQEQTSAACDLLDRNGGLTFSGVSDIGDPVSRACRGGALTPKELLSIASVLRCARTAKEYYGDGTDTDSLTYFFESLIANKYLEERIYSAIISDDEIADAASPELADIRRHMRIQSGKIRDSLQKVISSATYAKLLQEPIITIRQGRYVVPVKSECKNDFPGLVHDVSATGSTYFIEPMAAVNANNALRDLALAEEKEIGRILAAFSAEVAAYADALTADMNTLIRLDMIFAKAKYSRHFHGCEPILNDSGRIRLYKARHPLIDAEKVVPVTVRIGQDFDTMIITGPNTGGKTVTLKTVGLLVLMAECGLHIPADDSSEISTFDSVLADIGDEQSIALNLSTFSSHMRTIVDIVEACDSRSLVLFDELGAGTDPAEGAALAIALIEYCRTLGCRVMATTHYAELKMYAMRTEGVINASCEFDVETLQPTYKLLIGIPGKSNAFAISQRLGLPEDILKKASDLVGKNDKDFEDVLTQLEEQRRQMESARLETERLRFETEKIKKKSEEYNAQLENERNLALEQARSQAREIIEDARRTAFDAEKEIRQLKRRLSELGDVENVNQTQADIRHRLNEAEDKLRTPQARPERTVSDRPARTGDTVLIPQYGIKAQVLSIGKDGTLQLQAGAMKMSLPPDAVEILKENSTQKKAKPHPAHSGKEMQIKPASFEVDLRGMDSVEAVCVLQRFLDEAFRSNAVSVRIIHGKGMGILRSAVQQELRKNKLVKNFRLGVYGEGEDGVTIAEFA